MKVWAIALNTFREAVRDKVLYNLMAFAVLMIAASIALGQMSIAERKRITIDLGLSAISIFGIIISIFLGIRLVSREIENKTVYTLIAKPIKRYHFILGRYLGLMMVQAVNIVVMTLAFALVLWAVGGSEERNLDWALIQALILIFIEFGIVTAAAMVFSTFSTPILSAIFTLSLFISGRFMSGVPELVKQGDSLTYKGAVALSYLLPNLRNYVPIEEALHNPGGMPLSLFANTLGVGVLTAAIFLMVAMVIFQRRDFV